MERPFPRDVSPGLARRVDLLCDAELEALAVWVGRLREFRAAPTGAPRDEPKETGNRITMALPWAQIVDPDDAEDAKVSIGTRQVVRLDGPLAFLLVALRRDPFQENMIKHRVLDYAYWSAPAISALSTFHGGKSSNTYYEAMTSIISKLAESSDDTLRSGVCVDTQLIEFGDDGGDWRPTGEDPEHISTSGVGFARLTTFRGIFKLAGRCYNIDGAAYPGCSIPQSGGVDFWCTAHHVRNDGGEILQFEARVWLAVVRDDNGWGLPKKRAFYNIARHGQVDFEVVSMPGPKFELHEFHIDLRDFRNDRADDFDWYSHVFHQPGPIVFGPKQEDPLHRALQRYTAQTGLDPQDFVMLPPLDDEIDEFCKRVLG